MKEMSCTTIRDFVEPNLNASASVEITYFQIFTENKNSRKLNHFYWRGKMKEVFTYKHTVCNQFLSKPHKSNFELLIMQSIRVHNTIFVRHVYVPVKKVWRMKSTFRTTSVIQAYFHNTLFTQKRPSQSANTGNGYMTRYSSSFFNASCKLQNTYPIVDHSLHRIKS